MMAEEVFHRAGGLFAFNAMLDINLTTLGNDRIKKTVRSGQGQMPAFHESMLSERQLDALLATLGASE